MVVQFYIYVDGGVCVWIFKIETVFTDYIKRSKLRDDRRVFNMVVNLLLTSVEWVFTYIKKYFDHLIFTK